MTLFMNLQIFHDFLFLTDYIVLRARNIDLNEIFILLCINFFRNYLYTECSTLPW